MPVVDKYGNVLGESTVKAVPLPRLKKTGKTGAYMVLMRAETPEKLA
ncbi:MAG: hypothetical protein R3F19_25040 [Verrucomicrobiales bacterium]